MSREYAEKRIREALVTSKGNTHRAQQRIIVEAAQDHKLLLALTQGHLTGVVALWLNRVLTRIGQEQEETPPPEKPQMLDMEPQTFGAEILRALESSSSPMFGQESASVPLRRKQASQSHIDALRQMAGKKKEE